MANYHFNYFYNVSPSQQYPEYGVPAITTEPLEYVHPIYSVQYTGITTYEFNGTTYYNYNVYEVPVLSYSNSYFYDDSGNVDADNYILNVATEDESIFQEYYEQSFYTYSASYYSVEDDAINYISNVDAEAEIVSEEHDGQSSLDYYSVYSYASSDSNINDDVNVHNESNVLEEYIDVSENELTDDCEEQPLVYEENPLLDWSADVENNDVEEENEMEKMFVYEGNQVLDWSADIENDNIEEEDEKPFVYEENPLLDWSADVESSDIEEVDEVEKLFVYEGNQVLDWSADVENNNLEEEDESSIKVNFSTVDDKSPYDSPGVIKYLKERLYLEALYGRTGLKECLPVVDVLPIIYEESGSIEEYDTLEMNADDVKEREEIILCGIERNFMPDVMFETSAPFVENYDSESTVENVEQVNIANLIEKGTDTDINLNTSQPFIEKLSLKSAVKDLEQIKENPNPIEKNAVSDLTVKTSQPFTENHSLESGVKLFAQVKEEFTNTIGKDLTSDSAFDSPRRNLSDNGHLTTRRDEVFTNYNKPLLKDTKLYSSKENFISLTCAEKTNLSEENVSKSTETDLTFNAVLQKPKIYSHEKENLSKLQNDGIKNMEEDIATHIEPLCSNRDILLNPSEEEDNKKEVIFNPIHSIHGINTSTSHVLQETAPHGECLSEVIVENTAESNGKVSSKKEKKKFQNFRKWLSSFCCCVRKKT